MSRLNLKISNQVLRPWIARGLAVGVFAASTLAFAQQNPPADAPSSQQEPQDNGQAANGWPAANAQDGSVSQSGPVTNQQQETAPPQAQPSPQAPQPSYQPQPTYPSQPNYPAAQQPSYGPPSSNGPAYGAPGYGASGGYGNNQNPYGQAGQQQPYGQQPYGQPGPYAQQQPYPMQAPRPIPAELTLAPGAYVTVRLNQQLSSSRNRDGDAFTATLAEPVVINGVVVAEPGQTVGGVVTEVDKGNPAKLLVQLTELSLVDGQRLPITTKLVSRRGPGFTGQDAGTIVGTTAVGAGIGAVADWGTGAAIGAGVGAVVGALITHNHPSVLYPEQVLTFRIDLASSFSTQNAPQAFRYIEPGEYDRAPYQGQGPLVRPAPLATSYYGAYGYPYGWGYPYGYLAPTVGFYFGPGFYGRGYYGRGFYGGRFYRR